ncbi:Putative methyltransferase [Candidatus Phytoplasma australiense]|uniref:Putative methyltransferase n=1 Tax=Phytoplasma australiense TaxID=59748 RepID=B1VB00_PHYAS|nr:Putative methyltransferase [Candidatus Phytoplasma australiense]
MNKNKTSFDAFLLIKNIKGINYISNFLQVHKGTIKRWETQKSIPKNYDADFRKMMNQIEIEDPTINIIKISDNNLTNEKKFDEFYTTHDTALNFFKVLKSKMIELKVNLDEYTFIEPSAGNGSFYNLIPPNKIIGVDFNPNINKNYIIKNYLDFIPEKKTKNIVFGNPPFGLRGNLALRFINHSYQFADIIAFILPPLFESDGKGSPKKRVVGFQLMHSQKLPLSSFEYPDGKKVKVATVFQIWTKINTHLLLSSTPKTANNFVKIYSLSDGLTPSSIRNKKMLNLCDVYLPSTCFKGMKAYESFNLLPNKRGYGIKILKNISEIKALLLNHDWTKTAFLSTNSALNLRTSLITKVITEAGYSD